MEFLWQDRNMLLSTWVFAESYDHLPVWTSVHLSFLSVPYLILHLQKYSVRKSFQELADWLKARVEEKYEE